MKSLTRGKKKQAIQLLANNQVLEARALFEQVCRSDRQDVESWIYLVKINARLGDSAAVARCCRRIIALRPDLHEAHFHLGTALMLQGKHQDAVDSFRRALRLQPRHPATLFQLGKAYHLLTQFDKAMDHYRQALQLAPNLAEAHDSIGSILKYRGELDAAIEHYRRAVQIKPDFHKAHSDLVFALNYNPRYDGETIYREHLRWGQMHQLPTAAPATGQQDPDPSRRLRVGYVSPDFYKHSVAFFFHPLLSHHDPEAIETFCYSDTAKTDATTERLRTAAGHWRPIQGMSDAEFVNLVRQDRIDILVELTGHTANSRLFALTARPAPVQVTYLGYPNTTGVPAIDYRLTDAWADPPGMTDQYHSETLVRLEGGFLCYQPDEETPDIAPLPVTGCGHVTFGSFNNLAKITPEVVSLWSEILKDIPGSRLIVKNISLRDDTTRTRYAALFEAQGVEPERVELLPPLFAKRDHLALYSRIDIGLDTFPYNGTTTTCEALWMGVPVITLAGTLHAGRVGVSLLSQLGLQELVAESPQDYLRLARQLAEDLDRLETLRGGLRARMARSSLCDASAFARKVEAAYRVMWQKWCSRQQANP